MGYKIILLLNTFSPTCFLLCLSFSSFFPPTFSKWPIWPRNRNQMHLWTSKFTLNWLCRRKVSITLIEAIFLFFFFGSLKVLIKMNENSGVQFQRWNCFSLHLSLSISRSQVREETCSPAFSWVPFWAHLCSQEERPVLFLLWKVGVMFWLMHELLGRAEVLGPVSDIPICVPTTVSWFNYSTL